MKKSPRSLLLVIIAVYMIIWVPVVTLVVFSVNDSQYATSWNGFTLKWYKAFFQSEGAIHAIKVSLIIAFSSVLIATSIGTATAIALSRFGFRGKEVYRSLLLIPMIMPEVAMGVAMLVFFTAVGQRLGMVTIIIAHVAFSIPLTTLVVLARMQRIDPALEEAAQDLGADEITTMVKITLPLLMPGILSAALIAFPWSFNDYLITFFTAGVGTTTLPIHIFSLVKHGLSPMVNAIGTLVILLPILLVILAGILQRKRKYEQVT